MLLQLLRFEQPPRGRKRCLINGLAVECTGGGQRNNLSPGIEYFELLDAFRRRSCPHQISTGHHKISSETACRLRFTIDPIGGPAFHGFVRGRRGPRYRSARLTKYLRSFFLEVKIYVARIILSHLSRMFSLV